MPGMLTFIIEINCMTLYFLTLKSVNCSDEKDDYEGWEGFERTYAIYLH